MWESGWDIFDEVNAEFLKRRFGYDVKDRHKLMDQKQYQRLSRFVESLDELHNDFSEMNCVDFVFKFVEDRNAHRLFCNTVLEMKETLKGSPFAKGFFGRDKIERMNELVERIKNLRDAVAHINSVDPEEMWNLVLEENNNISLYKFCLALLYHWRTCDANEPAEWNDVAMFEAVCRGNEYVVGKLLNEGLDPNLRDRQGDTLLHQAVTWEYQDGRQLPPPIKISEGSRLPDFMNSPTLYYYSGDSDLHERHRSGRLCTVKTLLDHGADVGATR